MHNLFAVKNLNSDGIDYFNTIGFDYNYKHFMDMVEHL